MADPIYPPTLEEVGRQLRRMYQALVGDSAFVFLSDGKTAIEVVDTNNEPHFERQKMPKLSIDGPDMSEIAAQHKSGALWTVDAKDTTALQGTLSPLPRKFDLEYSLTGYGSRKPDSPTVHGVLWLQQRVAARARGLIRGETVDWNRPGQDGWPGYFFEVISGPRSMKNAEVADYYAFTATVRVRAVEVSPADPMVVPLVGQAAVEFADLITGADIEGETATANS